MNPRPRLEWWTVGAFTYSLGEFGTITGHDGLLAWAARTGEELLGCYPSLSAALDAVETAAADAGYEIAW